jgi:Fe-S cluster biosynthesis and repair protein YggX
MFAEDLMPLVCKRCGKTAEPPEAKRVPFGKKLKERLLASVCAECWKEWEAVEVRVVNEYRLNFLDPQHRDLLARSCLEFLNLPPEA